jgi:hypothetical protein
MRHSAILVFANKQDLKNALSPAETCEAMGLPQMKGRKWHVQVGGPASPRAGPATAAAVAAKPSTVAVLAVACCQKDGCIVLLLRLPLRVWCVQGRALARVTAAPRFWATPPITAAPRPLLLCRARLPPRGRACMRAWTG